MCSVWPDVSESPPAELPGETWSGGEERGGSVEETRASGGQNSDQQTAVSYTHYS